MITTFFTLKNYDNWEVCLYVAVDKYYTDEILDMLEEIDCPYKLLINAEKNLRSGKLNTGITYSNFKLKRSVVVIELTSCAALLYNSLRHEENHLCKHICQTLRIDPYSEDASYCAGEIAMAIFPYVQRLLCDECKPKLKFHNYESDGKKSCQKAKIYDRTFVY